MQQAIDYGLDFNFHKTKKTPTLLVPPTMGFNYYEERKMLMKWHTLHWKISNYSIATFTETCSIFNFLKSWSFSSFLTFHKG